MAGPKTQAALDRANAEAQRTDDLSKSNDALLVGMEQKILASSTADDAGTADAVDALKDKLKTANDRTAASIQTGTQAIS